MTTLAPIPNIMEVTLRDGSYVIDFQFTAEDTATLVSALEGAGFRWIEVGHGLGLNAMDKGIRYAAATDEAHLKAAAQAANSAKWGMFFIPGIGRAEDVQLAADYGMDFIRVGTNVTESERARPFIEQAKKLGMFTCFNAMKSYAIAPEEFARIAKQTYEWGADMVYLVDSAGTMLPEDVAAFIAAIQAECPVPIGFHGHDNLSMAMANTLQAIASGAAIVDSSLRGMGRSAGNVITEALVAIMQRRGFVRDIDIKATMDISAGLIAPLVPGRGIDSMAITAGVAGFHSAFTDKVKAYAEKYAIDVRDLIVRLGEKNRVSAPDDLLEHLSEIIAREQQARTISIPAYTARAEGEGISVTLPSLLTQLYSESQKRQSYSALNVVISQTLADEYTVSRHVHNSPTHTIGSVTVSTEPQLVEVLQQAEDKVDMVLLDTDRRRIFGPQMAAMTAADILKQTRLLVYSDNRTWSIAVKDQIIRLLNEQVQGTKIVIAGDHPRSRLLALMLVDYGAEVTVIVRNQHEESEYELATEVFTQTDYPLDHFVDAEHAADYLESAQVVVIWPSWGTWFGATMAAHVQADTYVIDAGIGSIDPAGLAVIRENKALPIRINIWPTLSGTLLAAHEGSRVAPAWGIVDGVAVVAGGAMGAEGAVIVDSVTHPTRVIGIANGNGGLLAQTAAYADNLRKVQESINTHKIQPQV
jgi:4-hydroxy 2-oxovalerate aldolase